MIAKAVGTKAALYETTAATPAPAPALDADRERRQAEMMTSFEVGYIQREGQTLTRGWTGQCMARQEGRHQTDTTDILHAFGLYADSLARLFSPPASHLVGVSNRITSYLIARFVSHGGVGCHT